MIVFGAFILGLTGFLAFITMFLGINSLDQTLYGLTLGIWLAAFFHYCLKGPIHAHIGQFLKGQKANPTGVLKYFIIGTVLISLTTLVAILAYIAL